MIKALFEFLPVVLRRFFSGIILDSRGEALLKEIFSSICSGIRHDVEIQRKLFFYIISINGVDYHKLINYIVYRWNRCKYRNSIGTPEDVLHSLMDAVGSGKRTWKYFEIPFIVFARDAIRSMFSCEDEKGKCNIIELVPQYSDEEYEELNVLDTAPAQETLADDEVSFQESVEDYKDHLRKADPQASEIFDLILQGMSMKQIASEMNIEFRIVANALKRHRRILKKYSKRKRK